MAQNNRIANPRFWFGFFWLASAAALAGALISQFGFDLRPCHLCLLQRWPYGIVMVLLTPLIFYKKFPVTRVKYVFLILALLFIADAAIAGYHTGVEKKWWAGPVECTTDAYPTSMEALTASILNASTVRCDEPAFVFLGLSMAAWNMFYALGLCGVALWRSRQN